MVQPYYDDGGITIYHADCADILDDLSADVVVTDPPWGVNGPRGASNRHRQRAKAKYLFSGWADTEDNIAHMVVPTIGRLIAAVGRVVLTPGTTHLDRYVRAYRPDSVGAFWFPAAQGRNAWGFTSISPILYYGRDPRQGGRQVPTGIAVTQPPPRLNHPCPKPYEAWKWLVAKASLEGEVVLDPFVGSGTTLVAAKELGRRAIGIDIEERYCEVAAERLSQAVMHLETEQDALELELF